jgi:hypothetical protein
MRWSLTDGLAIEAAAEVAHVVEKWLPLSAIPQTDHRPDLRRIVVGVLDTVTPPPASLMRTELLQLNDVTAFADSAHTVQLEGANGAYGDVDLASGRATLAMPANGADAVGMLNIAAALLLGREGRALLHAAAVVPPDSDEAWLLIGDARAGKTSTTATLMAAGWGFLSDDNVVLSAQNGRLIAQGWPRPFHLDSGWRSGVPENTRTTTHPAEIARTALLREAPIARLLMPVVDAGGATHLEPLSQGTALAALIRQSPWLMADAAVAPRILELLTQIAQLPAQRLVLGLDSFGQPGVLGSILAP